MRVRIVHLAKDTVRNDQAGFTRRELIVVIAMVALLGGLVLPTLAKSKSGNSNVQCLNNQRRLILAWQMYATDNLDRLIMAYHGGDTQGGAGASNPNYAGWCMGWLDWTTSKDNTNINFLNDPRYSKLAPHLGNDPGVFKCPSDTAISPAQRKKGWTSRVRSVSGNIGVGAGNAEGGPWDSSIYKHILKLGDFQYPSPAETWVYLDEHPDSINDPAFFNPIANNWVDQPASYHNGAAGVSFADGHAELHHWTGSLVTPDARKIRFDSMLGARGRLGDPDIHWMSYHGGRISEKSH